jgi:DNA-binding transcriptional MocR family regulator
MMRDRGLNLLEVGVQEDGMDIDALEGLLGGEHRGKIKLVYTIPVNHNPTGVTMSNAKRERLLRLAKEHDFKIVSDEAYQLLSFTPSGVVPLFYHDDPTDPRVLCVNTFSKLIGPGTKVGWLQAHPALLEPLIKIGWIDSGNNPAIMSSGVLNQFIASGAFEKHLAYVCETLRAKKDLLVSELRKMGLEPNDPQGGYFVWVKSKGKKTGRSGRGMSLQEDEFSDYMRLCFAWLTDEQIVEGVQVLREQ